MYWTLRFVRMETRLINLREVYYDDNTDEPLGHSEPSLMSESLAWPAILAQRVASAAALPVLDEGDL